MIVAQAEAHKARLAELLKVGSWQEALNLNKSKGEERLDLGGADLTDANLSGADLSGANLYNANLANANLTNTNLSGAWLTGADLTGANLTDTDLEGAIIPDGFLAPNTRLDAVPWTGTPAGWRVIASPRGVRFFPLPKA